MPDLAICGLGPVIDFGQQLRLDPDALVRDPFGVRLRLADQRLQSGLQVLCRGGGEAMIMRHLVYVRTRARVGVADGATTSLSRYARPASGPICAELGRLLGVKFWEVSPLDADSEAPPGYMRHNPLQAGYWRPSSRLRSIYFKHSEQCVPIDAEPHATP